MSFEEEKKGYFKELRVSLLGMIPKKIRFKAKLILT